MKYFILSIKILIFILSINYNSQAQNGRVEIIQNIEINKVIEIRKEINTKISMLRIQIFNGNREEAKTIKEQFERISIDSIVDIVYETPNYKIWVGKYFTQLEADRKLLEIKKTFPDAFIFRPILKPIIEGVETKEH